MKILVMSDTHGNSAALFRSLEIAGPVDLIAHLGDGEGDVELLAPCLDTGIIAVAGNCDIHSTEVRERILTWNGIKILMCHGDRCLVKQGLGRLAERAASLGVQLALYGHSHICSDETVSGVRLLNPGTLHRSAPVKTVALLEITQNEINWTPLTVNEVP